MKRIMLIIIFVAMIFSTCKNSTENITDTTAESYIETSAPTQIDPTEEFGGILFGMNNYEIISILGKKPDFIRKRNDEYSPGYIEYWDEEHFNVGNAKVTYCCEYDQVLHNVDYHYHYDDSEQEQYMNDFAAIKEEILRRYPEEVRTYNYNSETDSSITYIIHTENRSIYLNTFTNIFTIDVSIKEYDPTEDDQTDPVEELDTITFNKPQKAIIDFYGRQPDKTSDHDDSSFIRYENQTCFNISNAGVSYYFYKNAFDFIYISYSYDKDSEENSFRADYYSIRKKLMERYYESANYIEETDDTFELTLDDRFIRLSRFNEGWGYTINVSIDKRL